MTFPKTHLTLIHRLVENGEESDWRQFIGDYWRPVCRFAMRSGRLQHSDADDITSSTFEILIRNRLLLRWSENRTAKLRTLLCSVVRRQLSNRRRKMENQQVQLPLFEDFESQIDAAALDVSAEEQVAFDVLWLDELLVRTVDSLRSSIIREGKIHLFRVLFGRVCEGMTFAEIAECLGMPLTTVEAAYKQARDRLANRLRKQMHDVVARYATPEEFDVEFQREWSELAEHLSRQGGIEAAIRRSHESIVSEQNDLLHRVDSAKLETLCRLDGVVSRRP